LLDAAGQRIDIADGVTDNQTISLEGLDAGTYYAHVFGAAGATNSYSLALNMSASRSLVDVNAWTIMVYMTASNLEEYAFADINEMEDAASRLPGNVSIVVYWDQSA